MRRFQIREGDALTKLSELEAGSVQTCITSPPYFGLRDYGVEGQLGLEKTPEAYVAALVGVFRGVRRVLRKDSTLWLNLGDSYAGSGCGWDGGSLSEASNHHAKVHGADEPRRSKDQTPPSGMKQKDLMGIPWMVAFALRADGWYLRSDIIWNKPNPMPESVTDRPTKSHEYIFLLSKSAQYFYDAEAIKEPVAEFLSTTGKPAPRFKYGGYMPSEQRGEIKPKDTGRNIGPDQSWGRGTEKRGHVTTRNRRSVWTVTTNPYAEAHFATFPPKLIEPCILAGSRDGDTVLDPFAGAGTTGLVALRHNRHFIGIELNPAYCEMARRRVLNDAPLFNEQVA